MAAEGLIRRLCSEEPIINIFSGNTKGINIMIAIVTGASRGIGKACALKLAEDGYDIAVNYRSNDEEAQKTADEIIAMGRRALCCKADVCDREQVVQMVDEVCGELGIPDLLVNNAGVVDDRYLLMLTEDSLDRSLDINIKGYFLCAQSVALKMMRNKKGVIINMSSVSSLLALEGQSVYSATKGAVNSMTATLAKELARYGIRVNAIAPGFIETEMLEHIPDAKKDEYLKNIPQKRFGKPEDVANLVCALASDKLSYITGQTIVLDGGLSL